ncbi:MAG: hypothetical protein GJV46_16240 [Geobacter sp.]|nr:hypothetical protein [Geobacter sp.]
MSSDSCTHYLVTTGCIGIVGIVCDLVIPVPDIAVVIVTVPFIVAGAVIVGLPDLIAELVFIVVEDIVCPPFVLLPMANTWDARASATITATVVNFFICEYLHWIVISVER